jgi:hypothetical protein
MFTNETDWLVRGFPFFFFFSFFFSSAQDGRSHTEHYTVTVTDFLTMLDVSQWIHPVGIIQSVPLAEGGNLVNKSIMEVLTDYVQCDNTFKEIHMRKVPHYSLCRCFLSVVRTSQRAR